MAEHGPGVDQDFDDGGSMFLRNDAGTGFLLSLKPHSLLHIYVPPGSLIGCLHRTDTSFKTTNCLESVNALVEERCGKVDAWEN